MFLVGLATHTHTHTCLPSVTGGLGTQLWPLDCDTNPKRLRQMRRNSKSTHSLCVTVLMFNLFWSHRPNRRPTLSTDSDDVSHIGQVHVHFLFAVCCIMTFHQVSLLLSGQISALLRVLLSHLHELKMHI